MKYLTKIAIITINQKTILAHGGKFMPPSNYLNEHYLDYLLEIVSAEMFGKQMYPEISDKAGLYMYNIIANHIFQDGNKRTGLESAILFLRINGLNLSQELTNNDIYEFTIKVASGQSSLEECQAWFGKQVVPEYY
jgi:death on curing protein